MVIVSPAHFCNKRVNFDFILRALRQFRLQINQVQFIPFARRGSTRILSDEDNVNCLYTELLSSLLLEEKETFNLNEEEFS